MSCVKVCVVLLIVRNVNGLPKKSIEDIMIEFYGLPPLPHIKSVTEIPPVPQEDIEAIFGTPPTQTKLEKVLLFYPDDTPVNEDVKIKIDTEIDKNAFKSIWPDPPSLEEPEDTEAQKGITSNTAKEQFTPSRENTGNPDKPNTSWKLVLLVYTFVVMIVVCLCIYIIMNFIFILVIKRLSRKHYIVTNDIELKGDLL